jgi:hypothetical protein
MQGRTPHEGTWPTTRTALSKRSYNGGHTADRAWQARLQQQERGLPRQRRASARGYSGALRRAENQTDGDGSCLFYLFPPRLKLVVIWNESPHEGCGKPYRRQPGSNAVRTAKRRRCELSNEGSRSTSKREREGGIDLQNEANGFWVLEDADRAGRTRVTTDRIPNNALASFGFVRSRSRRPAARTACVRLAATLAARLDFVRPKNGFVWQSSLPENAALRASKRRDAISARPLGLGFIQADVETW